MLRSMARLGLVELVILSGVQRGVMVRRQVVIADVVLAYVPLSARRQRDDLQRCEQVQALTLLRGVLPAGVLTLALIL